MNGPQDRENRTPADPSMQTEKHHRHLRRRTNEPINARSIWIRGLSLLLAKNNIPGHKDGSHNRDRDQGSLQAGGTGERNQPLSTGYWEDASTGIIPF